MNRRTVSLVEVNQNDIETAVRRAIERAGGLTELIKPDSKVLIKPNINKPAPSGSGLVTDARVTEAVAKAVIDCNPASVVIGEGAAAGYDFVGAFSTGEAFRVSGTEEVAKRLGVPLINLNTDNYKEVAVENAYVMDTVKIAETALQSDVIISVPVLKSHIRTLSTISLKNMKGVMPGDEKRKTHAMGLDKGIADLISIVKPHYTVVDAVTVMQGTWEPEDRVELNLVLAGACPYATDMVGTTLIGFDPEKVMHLTYSMEREQESIGIDDIEVVGEPLSERQVRLKTGFEVFRQRYPQTTILEGKSSCTGCMGELIGSFFHARDAGFLDTLQGLTVTMGAPIKEELPEEKVLLLGKCCRPYREQGGHVRGCPPKEETILEGLSDICGFSLDTVLANRERHRKQIWEGTDEALKR
jgi:uncharacterized protein (DUF362 family)